MLSEEAEKVAVDRERIAVAEHRIGQTEKSLAKMEQWMSKLTDNMTALVKVQADQAHADRSINRLHERLDVEIMARTKQHAETIEWAKDNRGVMHSNSSWMIIFKTSLIAMIGGLIGGAINHLLNSGVI